MGLHVATDTPVFATGVLFGASLLIAGLWIGHWMAQRAQVPADRNNLDDYHMANLLRGLFQWTDGFASDVSEYRATVDQACEKFNNVDADDDDQRSLRAIMSQIAQANNGLKSRLEAAEGALKEQAKEIASYLSEARTDALTGLPNRRVFDDELTRRMAEWRRYRTPISVVLVDIDFFKKTNDTYGHLAGDAILQQVSQVLRDTMRESDLVVRLGGEEFAILLPGSEGENVCLAAERTRRAIEKAAFRYEGKVLKITVSCGAGQAVENETINELVQRTDEALYAAKGAGRNCAHWHDGVRLTMITRKPDAPDSPALPTDGELDEVCCPTAGSLTLVSGQ